MVTKTRKEYFLFCRICGTEMQTTRHDATTCSDECRKSLSLITRNLKSRTLEADKTITPEQKEVIKTLADSATGKGRVLKKILKSDKTKEVDIKKEEIKPEIATEKSIDPEIKK